MKSYRILVINPGSTSTKIGLYDNEKILLEKTIKHSLKDLEQFARVMDQENMRFEVIRNLLLENEIALDSIDAYAGRGGIIKPLESGVYLVNDNMLSDLQHPPAVNHASCFGGIIANKFAKENEKPCFVVDPVVVDERMEIAKISGIPGYSRTCLFHALNQKAVAKKYAAQNNTKYEDCRLIVAHMGGGITVGAHEHGRVIDVNDAFHGEGPFTPERCGGMQFNTIVEMCFSGQYTKEDMKAFANKSGGISAYLNTTDMIEVEDLYLHKTEPAKTLFEALAYNIAKEICARSAALKGQVDAIILTGGLAKSNPLVTLIQEYVQYISSVIVYPGEDELAALRDGVLRVLRGEEKAKEYQ